MQRADGISYLVCDLCAGALARDHGDGSELELGSLAVKAEKVLLDTVEPKMVVTLLPATAAAPPSSPAVPGSAPSPSLRGEGGCGGFLPAKW